MATNIIVARGGVEYVPPVSLAFWRWLTVFLILLPFFYSEILSNKKYFNKEFWKLGNVRALVVVSALLIKWRLLKIAQNI